MGLLTVSDFFDSLVKRYSVLVIVLLMSIFAIFGIFRLGVTVVLAEDYEVGVESGDWIEYELNWSVLPSEDYTVWVRREVLDVEDTVVTVNTTHRWSNGTVTSEVKEGDIVEGTAAPMIFIPSNLKPGDSVKIQGFEAELIDGVVQRTYLGIERTVLWADFSQKGFDVHIFWDREKGVALEIHHSNIASSGTTEVVTAQGITKVVETNILDSGSSDDDNGNNYDFLGIGTFIVIMIIIFVAFMVRRRYISSKRRKRSSASQCLGSSDKYVSRHNTAF